MVVVFAATRTSNVSALPGWYRNYACIHLLHVPLKRKNAKVKEEGQRRVRREKYGVHTVSSSLSVNLFHAPPVSKVVTGTLIFYRTILGGEESLACR